MVGTRRSIVIPLPSASETGSFAASPAKSTRNASRRLASERASSLAASDVSTPVRRRNLSSRVTRTVSPSVKEEDEDEEDGGEEDSEAESLVSRATHTSDATERARSPTPVKSLPSSQQVKTQNTPLSSRISATRTWSHTPSRLTLFWLTVSLPLVIWDTGYVLGRPHTMPGGKWHAPIWKPYALYGTVDYFYGFPAVEERDGWTAAQGIINVVETLLYLVYLYIVYTYSIKEENTPGRGEPADHVATDLPTTGRRNLKGRMAGLAVMLGFTSSVMTLSKTVLYFLNDWSVDWRHTGHNSMQRLILLWLIPNGAWIVFPIYMTYVFGAEILEGLAIAAGVSP